MFAKSEIKHKMTKVCYNCYDFYMNLEKEIISSKGLLKVSSIKHMCDPTYKENQMKKQHLK